MTARTVLALARREVVQELLLYASLVRWVARRPDVPSGATPIGYARLSTPMLWLWIVGSATEVVVVELVLRSLDAGWAEAIRLPLLALGVWGVVWMLGTLAASKVRPHLLTDDVLRVRFGSRTWVRVPLDAVRSVRPAEHDYEGVVKSLHHEDDLLLVGVSLRTNLEVVLDDARPLATSHGELVAARVGLWVDDPRETAAQLTARAAQRS